VLLVPYAIARVFVLDLNSALCGSNWKPPLIADVKSPSQCAGMNRYEVEDERALRERSSDPLGPESCAVTARDTVKRRQGIGGVGIQLRKDAIRTPTSL
jgi:hypothetical protein